MPALQFDFGRGILEVSLPQQPREADDIATERHPVNGMTAAMRAGEWWETGVDWQQLSAQGWRACLCGEAAASDCYWLDSEPRPGVVGQSQLRRMSRCPRVGTGDRYLLALSGGGADTQAGDGCVRGVTPGAPAG